MSDTSMRVEDEEIVTTWREDARPWPAPTSPWPTRRTPTAPTATASTGPTATAAATATPTAPTVTAPTGPMATASTSNLPAIERRAGDPAAFVRDHWAKAPLRRGPGPAASTTSCRWTTSTASWPPARPGCRPSGWSRTAGRCRPRPTPSRAGSAPGPWTTWPDPGKVFDQFAGGATIVLQSLHRSWAPLTAFCRSLELFFTHLGAGQRLFDPAVLTGPGRPPRHPRRVRPPGPRPQAVAGVGRGRALPLAHQKKLPPGAESLGEAPLVEAELAPGDCLHALRLPPRRPHRRDGLPAPDRGHAHLQPERAAAPGGRAGHRGGLVPRACRWGSPTSRRR